MKPARQSIILDIITEHEIETQNQLMEALAAKGIRSTQATLSRDIKDMRLVKELGANGRYHYTAGGAAETSGYLERLKEGRRNTYRVRADRPLRHPVEQGHDIGEVLAVFDGVPARN